MSIEGDDVFRHRADAIINALVGGRGFDEIPPALDDAPSAVELVAADGSEIESSGTSGEPDPDVVSDGGFDDADATDDGEWFLPDPTAFVDDENADNVEADPPRSVADRNGSTASLLSDQGADNMSQTTDTIASLLRGDTPASTTPGLAEDQPIASDDADYVDATAAGGEVRRAFFDDSPPPPADEDRIPVGALPPVHDDRDKYRYDPRRGKDVSDEDTDSVPAPDDAEASASFDMPAARESTWDRGRRLFSEHGSRKSTIIVASASLVVVLVIGFLVIGLRGDGNDENAATIATSVPAAQPSRPAEDTTDADGDAQIPVGDVTSRCPAGSTNPKLAFDNQMSTAWVCVRSFGLDGQVLRVRLQGAYVISSIGIVPGFNAATSDGKDQWGKHRTVTRVKYAFNDDGRTVYNQTTNNVRNEVVTRINPPVLASSVTITILQTTAPTSDPEASETPQGGDGARAELDDFAISSITINGHRPS